jgi:hypothetical protein
MEADAFCIKRNCQSGKGTFLLLKWGEMCQSIGRHVLDERGVESDPMVRGIWEGVGTIEFTEKRRG